MKDRFIKQHLKPQYIQIFVVFLLDYQSWNDKISNFITQLTNSLYLVYNIKIYTLKSFLAQFHIAF